MLVLQFSSRGKLSFKQPIVITMSNIIKQDVFETIWICSVLIHFWMNLKYIARFLSMMYIILNLVLEVKFTAPNIGIIYLEKIN